MIAPQVIQFDTLCCHQRMYMDVSLYVVEDVPDNMALASACCPQCGARIVVTAGMAKQKIGTFEAGYAEGRLGVNV